MKHTYALPDEMVASMDAVLRRGESKQALVLLAVAFEVHNRGGRIRVPTRPCEVCGRPFIAVRVTARMCSATCRKKASHDRKAARSDEEHDEL